MPSLTDDFIRKLLSIGKSEKESSSILSDIVTQSIFELYTSKITTGGEALEIDRKLQQLLERHAPNEHLYKTLGITPTDLENKMQEKISNFLISHTHANT